MHGRLAFLAASLLAGAATAQSSHGKPAPEHVRGDIVAIDGNTLTVKSRGGETLKLQLADDVRVAVAEKGDWPTCATEPSLEPRPFPQPDGTLRRSKARVFPSRCGEPARAHRHGTCGPGSTMTNATVERSGCGGREVAEHDDECDRGQSRGAQATLKYSDGEKTVVLPPDVTVVKLEPADRSQLKPGVHLFALASRQPDGTLRAERVTIGKDGVVPPM